MDEGQLRKLSVIGSVASLFVLYVIVLYVVPESVNICDITFEHAGRIINVTGTAKDVIHRDGNVFFTLSGDGCEIRVVLWKNVVSGIELRGTNASLIQENVTVNLAGEVDVHGGYLQIVPTRPEVKLIS